MSINIKTQTTNKFMILAKLGHITGLAAKESTAKLLIRKKVKAHRHKLFGKK